jgi:hypothetical protein
MKHNLAHGGRGGRKMLRMSLLFFALLPSPSRASNWAQAAGDRAQNFAFPYQQSPVKALFSPREGHSVVVVGQKADSAGKLFLLGGDDFTTGTSGLLKERGGGYRNDVWTMKGLSFALSNTTRVPMAEMIGSWEEVLAGRTPPSGVSYESWIACQNSLLSALEDPSVCDDASSAPGSYKEDNMWSPRRGHATVEFKGQILVLGGRAREHSSLPRESAVGGLLLPPAEPDPFFSSWNERSVVRNDVWASDDLGRNWKLLTPGCVDPQEDLILGPPSVQTGSYGARYGTSTAECDTDADCYGAAECRPLGDSGKTCVCPMWSPREAHTAVVHNDKIYVLGGFASVRQARCGMYACGAADARSHRAFMSDIWVSSDGADWQMATPSAGWSGRGDFAVVTFNSTFVLMGGTGMDNTYLNDVWSAGISEPARWKNHGQAPWPARGGLQAAVEEAAAINGFTTRLYMSGGHAASGIYADVWGRSLSGSKAAPSYAEGWAADYSPNMAYRTTAAGTTGFVYGNAPQAVYVDSNSPLSQLMRVWLPISAPPELGSIRLERKPYESLEKMEQLAAAGLKTVADLASADKYTILKLRGFSPPGTPEEEIFSFGDSICDLRELAIALVAKCEVDPTLSITTQQAQQAGVVQAVFGGRIPSIEESGSAQWYHRVETPEETTPDFDTIISEWDGCSPLEGIRHPDISGIGVVTVPENVREPHRELQELSCLIHPGKRTHHELVYYDQSVLLIGGRTGENSLAQDVWIRDDRTPTAFIDQFPADGTPGSKFTFTCDEPACTFEVRLYDEEENLEVLPWTKLDKPVYSVSWLNRWKGGAGEGDYILYVRAMDAAGNTDYSYRETLNMYRWHYVSPLPWDIIWGVGTAGFVILLAIYFEYRRRKKKRAMEKYAMKRMRRKFKQQMKNKTKVLLVGIASSLSVPNSPPIHRIPTGGTFMMKRRAVVEGSPKRRSVKTRKTALEVAVARRVRARRSRRRSVAPPPPRRNP